MTKKIKLGDYVKRILAFQSAIGYEETEIKFERDGLDNKKHLYLSKRFIDDGKWSFSLKQDGKKIIYPNATVKNLNEIVNEYILLCRNIKFKPQEFSNWDAYLSDLARADRAKAPKVEKLAAWLETIQRMGLISTSDLKNITSLKYPKDVNHNKFVEKIIKTDTGLDQKDWKTPISSTRAKSVVIKDDSKYVTYDKLSNTELEGFCLKYLSDEFKKEVEVKLPHREISKSPMYNEPAFSMNLLKYYNGIIKKIPEEIIPMNIQIINEEANFKESSEKIHQPTKKDSKEENEAVDFFKEKIQNYIKDRNPNAEFEHSSCWFMINEIAMGKTTFMERLFCELTEDYKDNNLSVAVPFLIRARDIKGPEFAHWFDPDFKYDVDFINALRYSCKIKKRKLIFLIDGLDEMNHKLLETTLELCRTLVSENIFVLLTSRPVHQIKIIINDKLPNINNVELYYDEKELFDLIQFPGNLRNILDKKFLLSIFIESLDLLVRIRSPLFFKLLADFFRKSTFNDISHPIKFSMLMDEYYKSLLDYGKRKGVIPHDTLIQEFIRAGVIVAKALYFEENQLRHEADISLLKRCGLIIGDIENPQFSHLIYQYDLLARSIVYKTPAFTPKELWQIIKNETEKRFNVVEHAIRLTLSKTSADDDLLGIDDELFDLIESLYEDNSYRFSRLKALVWKGRGKGATPLVNHIQNYILNLKERPNDADDPYFNYAYILRQINVRYPNFERKLFSSTKIDFIHDIQREVSRENVDFFIKGIKTRFNNSAEIYREIGSDILDKLFRAIIWSKKPINYFLDLIPEFFFETKYFLAIEMNYAGQTIDFYRNLVSKLCASKYINQLVKYLYYSEGNPFLLPNLDQMEDKKELFIESLYEVISSEQKPHKSHPKQLIRHSDDMQQVFFEILQNFLNTQKYDESIELIEIITDNIGESKFRAYMKSNSHLFEMIVSFMENHLIPLEKALDDSINLRKIQSITSKLINYVIIDDKLTIKYIQLLRNPDNIASFLKQLENKVQTLEKRIYEPWKTCCIKLKRLLKKKEPKAYEELIIDFQYSKTKINYEKMWCEESDLRKNNLLDGDQKGRFGGYYSYSGYFYSERAMDLLIKTYFESVLNDETRNDLQEEIKKKSNMGGRFNTFCDLIQVNTEKFSSLLQELIDSEEPQHLINSWFEEYPPDSFKDSFWDVILQMLKEEDEYGDNYWICLMESFHRIKIDDRVKMEIKQDERLVSRFLDVIYYYDLNPSVLEFLEDLIEAYPSLVQQRYNGTQELLKKMIEHYEIYDEFLIEQFIRKISFNGDIDRQLMDQPGFIEDLITRGAENVKISWFYYLTPEQEKTIIEVLKKNEKNKFLIDFYERFMKERPIKWIAEIQDSQEEAIKLFNRFTQSNNT